MWRRTADGRWKRVKAAPGHTKEGGMESNSANFIVASGDGRWSYFNDSWRAWEHYTPGALLCAEGDRVWILQLLPGGNSRMAEQSSPTRESRRGGCHCNKCVGDRAPDGKGKAVEEMQGMGSGEASLVEKCYITENSAADRQILARLERELQGAFRFEIGSEQPISSLWVV